MTDQNLTTTITVNRSPAEVFAAVLDVCSWWSRGVRGGTSEPADEFHYEVPGVHRSHIRVVEVVPNRRVTWQVLDNWLGFVEDHAEWTGTRIHFDLTEREGGTELRFTHVGLVPDYECFDACRQGWGFYIEHSLRDLITTGTGRPNGLPEEIQLLAEQGLQA